MGCHSSKFIINTQKSRDYEAALTASHEEACTLISELRCFNNPTFKKSLLNNQDLLNLAREHLDSAITIKKLLTYLKLRLTEARNKQAVILQCLNLYEEKEYTILKKNLMGFKEARDIFDVLSTDEFSLLREKQLSFLDRLMSKKNEIKEKLSSMKRWKKIWKVMHNAIFISVLACSVILIAMSAPAFTVVAMTAGSTAIKTAEQWIDSIWENRTDLLEGEKEVVLMMTKGESLLGVHELGSISLMIKRLEIKIGSMSGDLGFASMNQEDEIAMEMAMEEVKGKVGFVGKWIDEVEMKVHACNSEIKKAVVEFLNVITNDL